MLYWGGSELFEWRCRYLPGMLRSTTARRCGNLSPCSDLNMIPPEYEGQVSAVRQQHHL
jgi:hypothetical protein